MPGARRRGHEATAGEALVDAPAPVHAAPVVLRLGDAGELRLGDPAVGAALQRQAKTSCDFFPRANRGSRFGGRNMAHAVRERNRFLDHGEHATRLCMTASLWKRGWGCFALAEQDSGPRAGPTSFGWT